MSRPRTSGGGGGGSALEWVQITEAMLDGGSAITTNSTLQSYAVTAGRVILTAAAFTSHNGLREISGRAVLLTDILPGFDASTSDLFVHFDAPASTNANCLLVVGIVDTPGATCNGIGVLSSSGKCGPMSTSTTTSLSDKTGLSEGIARFMFAPSIVAVQPFTKYTAIGSEYEPSPPNVAPLAPASITLTPSGLYAFFAIATYSGSQTAGATTSAAINLAAAPKLTAP